MKNPERVAELLAELQAECETPQELATVRRCVRDLEEPPKIEIISDATQIFDGITFHKLKSGYYQGQIKMHRYVWQRCFGDIPEDYVIHHKDHNPENNNIANLQVLSPEQHAKIHEQELIAARKAHEFTCAHCGKVFSAYSNGENCFCSKECQRAYRQTGSNYQKQCTCVICGKPFTARKDKKTKTCSPQCAGKFRSQKHTPIKQTEQRTCIICGKLFMVNKRKKTKTCSSKCAHVLHWQKRRHSNNVDK